MRFLTVNILFSLLLLTGTPFISSAQDEEVSSTAEKVDVRAFDEEAIQAYEEDSDFDYNREKEVETYSIWDYIEDWLQEIFQAPGGETTFKTVIYGVSGLALLFLILQLLGISPRRIFKGETKSATVSSTLAEDDIYGINFDTEIGTAETNHNWKGAIRLQYLKVLKQLADQDLIAWRIEKTNHEYEIEIKSKEIRQPFQDLTLIYEWICYGDFHIDQIRYQQFKQQFQAFSGQIRNVKIN